MADLQTIEEAVNHQIIEWLALESQVTMQCDGKALTDSRYWIVDFGIDGIAKLPCGGTHVSSFKEYATITVKLEEKSEQELLMLTTSIKK